MAKKPIKKKQTKALAVVKPKVDKALILNEIRLSQNQLTVVNSETPEAFIKKKPGRGGKSVTYVEGGYVINRLNAAFSPVGWEFNVTERGETERCNEKNSEGEVWVYGVLTVIDHKNGFRVNKGQYGQHPLHKNVPYGDALKAAGTDALKKCASLYGIALDVYWGQLDSPEEKDEKKAKPTPEELFERAKMMIYASRNVDGLIQYAEKLKGGKTFTKAQTEQLLAAVNGRVDSLQSE
jgi:hypothetical protein